MELGGEEWFSFVADPLISAVVHIDEMRLPIGGDCIVVNGKAVVLRCYIAFLSTDETHGLVMASMTIFKFIHLCSGRLAEKLISHADSTYRLPNFKSLAYILHSFLGKFGRTRAVADEESVVRDCSEIVVPGHEGDAHATSGEAADDIIFCAAIHEYHSLLPFSEFHHFLSRNLIDKIFFVRVTEVDILSIFECDLAEHRAFLSEKLSQGAGVDTINSRDFFVVKPI